MTIVDRIQQHAKVDCVSDERTAGHGFWVYLSPPWCYSDQGRHSIHKDSPTECWRELRWAERCVCDRCSPGGKRL